MGQTGKRSFGSGDNGVTDDNPVLQNPLTNTKSCTAEQRSTPPLLMLLCLQHALLNLIFNKLSKNGLLSTNFRWLSQFLHLTGKRPFHKFQEESSSDFSQLQTFSLMLNIPSTSINICRFMFWHLHVSNHTYLTSGSQKSILSSCKLLSAALPWTHCNVTPLAEVKYLWLPR